MAGILDSKKRIFDTIVTNEGRRQLSLGKMRIRFATFTDQDAFYEPDAVSGSADTSTRLHLEAFSRPQDTITFEANSAGNLVNFEGGRYGILNGQVITPTGSNFLGFPATDARRTAQFDLLTSSLDNFSDLYSIATNDPFDDVGAFTLSTDNVTFNVTDDMLQDRQGINVSSIEDVESLFRDRRLSHIPNFRYLPPVNAPSPNNPEGSPLGTYPRLDQGEILTFEELLSELDGLERADVEFTENSREGNIFGQFFDVRDDLIIKMDVIDFGEFSLQGGDVVHVFFVGRIFEDAVGTHTFVNVFTLMFS